MQRPSPSPLQPTSAPWRAPERVPARLDPAGPAPGCAAPAAPGPDALDRRRWARFDQVYQTTVDNGRLHALRRGWSELCDHWLAEITRLGVALGGDAHTFAGLSGMGDLVLPCTGDLSRNRSVGLAIGSGAKLEDILADMNEVTEGVYTSLAARQLGVRAGVEMPITGEVCAMLHEGKDPRQAVIDLTARDLRDEVWS